MSPGWPPAHGRFLDAPERPRLEVEATPEAERETEKGQHAKLQTHRGGVFSEGDRGSKKQEGWSAEGRAGRGGRSGLCRTDEAAHLLSERACACQSPHLPEPS